MPFTVKPTYYMTIIGLLALISVPFRGPRLISSYSAGKTEFCLAEQIIDYVDLTDVLIPIIVFSLYTIALYDTPNKHAIMYMLHFTIVLTFRLPPDPNFGFFARQERK